MAKDVNRQDSAEGKYVFECREERAASPVTRPPVTAVRRVDLCLHSDTETGDSARDTQLHSGDSQPATST